MTGPCPDWRDLAAHRHANMANMANIANIADFTGNPEEPAGWPAALEHLDGCPACRRTALEADPTLLFRRLPGLAAEMSAGEEAAEVEAMRQAVAAMRTAKRLEPSPERAAWKRWAAAAALAAAALSLGAGHGQHRGPAVALVGTGTVSALPRALPSAALSPVPQAVPRFASEQVPMVEELNRPAARVYQMDGGKNLSVVMIVDERLDV